MGSVKRRKPKSRQGKDHKARKLTQTGAIKRKRGDSKVISSRAVGFKVKQKKGGKWVKVGERVCKIHSKCDCVRRTDLAKLRQINNR